MRSLDARKEKRSAILKGSKCEIDLEPGFIFAFTRLERQIIIFRLIAPGKRKRVFNSADGGDDSRNVFRRRDRAGVIPRADVECGPRY